MLKAKAFVNDEHIIVETSGAKTPEEIADTLTRFQDELVDNFGERINERVWFVGLYEGDAWVGEINFNTKTKKYEVTE